MKPVDVDELKETISRLEKYLNSSAEAIQQVLFLLSNREKQVYKLLLEGMTSKDIATCLEDQCKYSEYSPAQYPRKNRRPLHPRPFAHEPRQIIPGLQMISQKFLKILTHPLFIGLLITLAVLYFIPPVFNRYRIQTIENTFIHGNELNYYEDLDGDHSSEKIRFDLSNSNLIKILLYNGSNTVSQNNLNYQPASGRFFYFGDLNNDRHKELFVFSWNNDSVFLNILDLLSDKPLLLRERFIDRNGYALNGHELPIVQPVGLIDYDNDGNKEFVFNLHSGFGKQPRNLYVYNILTRVPW